MCFVIAVLFCLDIYTFSLNTSRMEDDSLYKLFQELPSRRIVLLEDVDNAEIGQPLHPEDSKSEEVLEFSENQNSLQSGVSLSALLNFLDGVGAQEGRILIMTTKHPENLDAALTRPGWVDKEYSFGYTDKHCVESTFFNDGSASFKSCIAANKLKDQPAGAMANETIRDLSIEFANLVPEGPFKAAEIQNYLLNRKNDSYMAVKEVGRTDSRCLTSKEFQGRAIKPIS
ncbi:hypothetical protein N7495_007664 [Penicillium taxi]|uniref:uncharacterized protein n=1 Tax=Penicillium taxi TaxID=168475 RepID=UPI0025459DA9|nr:uncharacterized protein N7495_007664 [Penicillium taxi]KAJ5887623.1 hypothetical protein N7495_007664 [Penicillium taxi]